MSNSISKDLSEVIAADAVHFLIDVAFVPTDPTLPSPIFPLKVTHVVKYQRLVFCELPIQQTFCLSVDDQYAFFMLVRRSYEVYQKIRTRYGYPEAEISVDIDGSEPSEPNYHWDVHKLIIILSSFHNFARIEEYQNCYMVIVGNMEYRDMISLPEIL
jgi:hypothetical protein